MVALGTGFGTIPAVSFLKRLFSSDRRAALRAEATGDFELAAERYALADDAEAVVRMHLARAQRAGGRQQEVDALRDAVYWAREDEALLMQARPALGLALLAQSKAEGIATQRDRERVREAATLLQASEKYDKAGDAFVLVDDNEAAVGAYRAGGLVAKLELLLGEEQEKRERGRSEKNDYADYEMFMRGGNRDRALASLRAAANAAEKRSEYQHHIDELESRLIVDGRIRLRDRRGESMSVSGTTEVLLGRDVLCDLVLRSGGISRNHASITVAAGDDEIAFSLSDAGSRNGTRVSGMPLESSLKLVDTGTFQLGDQLETHYSIVAGVLHLEVKEGLDRGAALWVTSEAHAVHLAPLGLDASLEFRDGRPLLLPGNASLRLNDERIVVGDIQLIHGDRLDVNGLEIEVL